MSSISHFLGSMMTLPSSTRQMNKGSGPEAQSPGFGGSQQADKGGGGSSGGFNLNQFMQMFMQMLMQTMQGARGSQGGQGGQQASRGGTAGGASGAQGGASGAGGASTAQAAKSPGGASGAQGGASGAGGQAGPNGSSGNAGAVENARGLMGKHERTNQAELSKILGMNPASTPWCAFFATAMLKKAGVNIPKMGAVSGIMNWGKKNGKFLPKGKKPQKGDVVIFKNGRSHTGLVDKVFPDGSFSTIEGNAGDKVKTRKYPANERSLTGFVRP